MYSFSSLERNHQIALFIISLLLLCSIIFGALWYSNHVLAPNRFIEKVRQAQEISVEEIDIESIKADLTIAIGEQLKAQLATSNIDQPEQAMEIMLPQAAAFLANDSEVAKVMNQQLKLLSKDVSDWQEEQSTSVERLFRINDHCLMIKRIDHNWLLHKLYICDVDVEAEVDN